MSSDTEVDRELATLEPIFHRLPPRTDRRAIEALLEPDFLEVGASGVVYTRHFVLDVVEQRYRDGQDPNDAAWTITDFRSIALATDVYLVTYRLRFQERLSRRCTRDCRENGVSGLTALGVSGAGRSHHDRHSGGCGAI
ncbi:DUF4440 domain-containing protein [Gordonia hongkongensis]|uniref:DUF4440 domain-containing protein n=1 Tax=Gordonia hongkongensis TaxID=1701090 RepID=UPI0034DFC930